MGCKNGVKCTGLSGKWESKVGKRQDEKRTPSLLCLPSFPTPLFPLLLSSTWLRPFSHHRPFKFTCSFSFLSIPSDGCRPSAGQLRALGKGILFSCLSWNIYPPPLLELLGQTIPTGSSWSSFLLLLVTPYTPQSLSFSNLMWFWSCIVVNMWK